MALSMGPRMYVVILAATLAVGGICLGGASAAPMKGTHRASMSRKHTRHMQARPVSYRQWQHTRHRQGRSATPASYRAYRNRWHQRHHTARIARR